ncbi:NAD(+) diphosphatase [Aureimonas populi]|uniref:NAD(+) diphosphatase n=1 Tax=Aureimonas populi TaxID=1701758 RepID=A0ABW5CKX8_9HYPH|nr:NAD(+) diphosphatase [Aureimonas populi]
MSALLTQAAPAMGFCGNRLVRSGEERSEETLALALRHADARIFLSLGGQWLCRTVEGRADPAFALFEAQALGGALEEAVLLGWRREDGAPRLALALPEGMEAPGEAEPLDLRTLAMEARLDAEAQGELAQGQHLLTWHRRTRFCGLCGGRTVSEIAGYRRRCTACGQMHFPRTDPVAIMLIHDGEGNGLLGRQHHFKPGMWSCLAGFVEPGETIEDAVRRETQEEAGIMVGEVAYEASQPWPFPGSLMIGCRGRALTSDITMQDAELEGCRWFTRAEMQAMLEGRHADGLSLPSNYAIAHQLVRRFLGG